MSGLVHSAVEILQGFPPLSRSHDSHNCWTTIAMMAASSSVMLVANARKNLVDLVGPFYALSICRESEIQSKKVRGIMPLSKDWLIHSIQAIFVHL